MSVIPATTEAAVTAPPPEPAKAPEPGSQPLAEFVRKQYEQHAADESVTTETPATTEAETPAAEAKVETPEPEAVVDEPFTPEQLRDRKHWDSLDKAGWERAEKLHPVETARVKAGYAAASRIAEDARKSAATRAAEPEKPASPEVDPYEEALAKTDSLDPAERAEGFRALARLEAQKLIGEMGIDPTETAASAVERSAWRSAVEAMPALANLSSTELDAAVEADPDLMDDVQFAVALTDKQAKVRLLAKVMTRAGKIVLAKQESTKAAAETEKRRIANEAKDAETQKRLQSNRNNASSTVVDTPGGKVPGGEKTIEETVRSKVAALKLA